MSADSQHHVGVVCGTYLRLPDRTIILFVCDTCHTLASACSLRTSAMSLALHSATVGLAQLGSIPNKQLSQRWKPSPARRCVVLAASSPPPMRSFDPPISSSNGSSSSSTSTIPSAAAPSAAAAAPASPGDASYRSYRVSPWAAMKFNGPVPERVNGRLAMLAFLYIAQHEAETGQTGVSGPALRLEGMEAGLLLLLVLPPPPGKPFA